MSIRVRCSTTLVRSFYYPTYSTLYLIIRKCRRTEPAKLRLMIATVLIDFILAAAAAAAASTETTFLATKYALTYIQNENLSCPGNEQVCANAN